MGLRVDEAKLNVKRTVQDDRKAWEDFRAAQRVAEIAGALIFRDAREQR
jgi:hypothetical protein